MICYLFKRIIYINNKFILYKRTAVAIGVSEATVKTIKQGSLDANWDKRFSSLGKHRKKASHLKCNIDDLNKCIIRQTIQDFYTNQKKVPSISKLHPILREIIIFSVVKINFVSNSTLKCFSCKKCVSRPKNISRETEYCLLKKSIFANNNTDRITVPLFPLMNLVWSVI